MPTYINGQPPSIGSLTIEPNSEVVINGQNADLSYSTVQLDESGNAKVAIGSAVDLATDSEIIIKGIKDNGTYHPMNLTAEGHVEVEVHGPRLPFGSLHAECLTPIFQFDGVYRLNSKLVLATSGRAIAGAGTGTTSVENEMLKCSTGTTSYSFASIQSRKRLRYRPGQGVINRFAGYFTAGVASSIQVIGCGTSESGFYFGYNGTSFGILHVKQGVREIHTFTITTASTSTNDAQVTLPNGVVVTVSGITNSGNIPRTAYELSKGTYPGWAVIPKGNTLIFLRADAGPTGGSFSVAQSGAVTPIAGSDVTTKTGVASSDVWIPQASWNGADILDGNGPSGVTLDPTKGNVYQIGIQYLGFGSVTFQIEINADNSNNPTFVNVHTIRNTNELIRPHVSQPSFPFTMAAYSAGSTTDVSVYVGSAAGFIEGKYQNLGPRSNYYRETNNYVGSTASTYYPMFTVRNNLTFSSRANQCVVQLKGLSCSHDDATPVTFFLLRNATLLGNPSFADYSSDSCTSVDTAATSCTITSQSQIEFTLCLGQSGGGYVPFDDEITLQPGEEITLAARAVTGTATYVIAELSTREDQ